MLMDNPPRPAPASGTKAPSLGSPGRSFPSTFERKKPHFSKPACETAPAQGRFKVMIINDSCHFSPRRKITRLFGFAGSEAERNRPAPWREPSKKQTLEFLRCLAGCPGWTSSVLLRLKKTQPKRQDRSLPKVLTATLSPTHENSPFFKLKSSKVRATLCCCHSPYRRGLSNNWRSSGLGFGAA